MIYCKDWSYCNEQECCPYLHWMTDQIMKAQWYEKEKIIQKAENKSKEINAFQTFARKLEYQETVTCVDDDWLCNEAAESKRSQDSRERCGSVMVCISYSLYVCLPRNWSWPADGYVLWKHIGRVIHGMEYREEDWRQYREEKDKTFIFVFYILIPNILHSMFIFCFAEFITLT